MKHKINHVYVFNNWRREPTVMFHHGDRRVTRRNVSPASHNRLCVLAGTLARTGKAQVMPFAGIYGPAWGLHLR